MLLETSDPGLISRLAATRRGKSLIQRTLSPRALVVDPTKLELLARRLTEQEGVPPRVEDGRWKIEDREPREASILHHQSSILFLAVQVYQHLGRHLDLPVRIPQSVIDQLTPHLSPTDLAATDVALANIEAGLHALSEGRTPFPPWPEGGVPVAESLALIETALATGQALDLDYYAASTDRLTHRVVEPYRVEWHGPERSKDTSLPPGGIEGGPSPNALLKLKTQTPYLVAFCHHAQAERMFRLDRIRGVALIPSDHTGLVPD
jgi:hypothetical protein